MWCFDIKVKLIETEIRTVVKGLELGGSNSKHPSSGGGQRVGTCNRKKS